MIRRNLTEHLRGLATRYSAITLTGPRQSGKTTLVRAAFPHHPLVSLEDPDVRSRAQVDPRGFLNQYASGAIFDEVQRAPDLLSFLQGVIDSDPIPGRFVLTGSQHFSLMAGVTQSLAGRTSIQVLLPFSHDEVERFDRPRASLDVVLWSGGTLQYMTAPFRRLSGCRRIPPPTWIAMYAN